MRIKLVEMTLKLCEHTSGMSEMYSSPTCFHLVTMDSVFHSCTCIAQHYCTNGQIRACLSGQIVVNRNAGSFLCKSNLLHMAEFGKVINYMYIHVGPGDVWLQEYTFINTSAH